MNKAYASYVPINQKWAKQIPSHWDAGRMKAVFAMRKERNNPIVTENILSLTNSEARRCSLCGERRNRWQ